MAWCGDLHRDDLASDRDVSITHDEPTDFQDAQALGVDLRIAQPGTEIARCNRSCRSPSLTVDRQDCVDVDLSKAPKKSHLNA